MGGKLASSIAGCELICRQDPVNAQGGKWIVRVPKAQTSRLWEDLLFAVIGDQVSVRVISAPLADRCGMISLTWAMRYVAWWCLCALLRT